MNCRICGNDKLELYYTQGSKNQFKFYKCTKCSLVNLDMSMGLNQEKYALSYIDPDDMSLKQNKDQEASYKFIRKYSKTAGKYLDIGCGNGKLLQLAKKDGCDVHGLELTQFFADKIKERLDINVTVANFMEYDSETTYDLLTLRHVLEHIPDPIYAMTKINKLLKPGSFAELEFPNIEGYSLKVKRFMNKLGLFKKKYKKDYIPGHCNEFSKKSFNQLSSITGFKMIKHITYSSKPFMSLIYKYAPIGCKTRVIIQKVSEVA